MHVHLIFVTKYRRSVFDGNAIERLGEHFRRVANDFEAKVVECNGEENHIHLLVEYHPKISISLGLTQNRYDYLPVFSKN